MVATLALAALLGVAAAYPSPAYAPGPYHQLSALEKRNLASKLGVYQAPSATDSRGPCPMLNTLANHGLLPRNGRNLDSDVVLAALAQAPGIDSPALATNIHNFGILCTYVNNGKNCSNPATNGATFLFPNLTMLAEPHAFEHDHSYSRQDPYEKYGGGSYTDNLQFNASVFQTALDVIHYQPSFSPSKTLANYSQFNEIRLQRQSLELQSTVQGLFFDGVPVTLFETGFIFGMTYDRDTNGQMVSDSPSAHPQARVDWWNFWFSEESFPTQLGWVPAPTQIFNLNFIESVSSAVLHQTVTSTPAPLPSGALNPSHPLPAFLPATPTEPIVKLIYSVPYVGPNPNQVGTEAPQQPTAKPTAGPNSLSSIIPQAPTTTTGHSGYPTGYPTGHPTGSPTGYPGHGGGGGGHGGPGGHLESRDVSPQDMAKIIAAPAHVVAAAKRKVGPAPALYNMYKDRIQLNDLKSQKAGVSKYTLAMHQEILALL